MNGHSEEIDVDLAKLHDGKIADPLIQTDDILFVPRSLGKMLTQRVIRGACFVCQALEVIPVRPAMAMRTALQT